MKKLKSTDEILDESFWTGEWDGTGDEIANLLTQDRNQAYTRLVAGIEGMKKKDDKETEDRIDKDGYGYLFERVVGYNIALTDILENVVKPLYGKK